MTLRILIADDHEMVREGLEVMINKIPDLELIGQASGGEELVQLTRKLLPEVVLTDIQMPGMDGIVATTIIKKEFPHIGVIALSSFDEESLIKNMLKAGARGYILKNAGRQELRDAVHTVYRDEPYYCRQIKTKVSEMVARGGTPLQADRLRNQFTVREREVIHLMCQGLSSKQIAARLNLQTRTVERYRDSIMEKMDVSNATALVAYAFKHGLDSKPTETE